MPLSLLGVERGDTFGMIIQARDQNTDLSPALSLNSWPGLAYGFNAPYDLRNYALVTIPLDRVGATARVDPETLNLRAQGRWITAHVELPGDHDVEGINLATVRLVHRGKAVAADWGEVQNGVLVVKFDWSAVAAILEVGDAVEVLVVGEVNGVRFEGNDRIRVVQPAPVRGR